MADRIRAPRRTKKEKLNDDIAKIDAKIAEYNEKAAGCEAKKNELLAMIKEIEDAEKKAEEEEKLKVVMALIKEKNVSIDELKSMIENL